MWSEEGSESERLAAGADGDFSMLVGMAPPHFRYARAPILMARPRLPRKPLPAARSELRTLAFDDLTTLYLGDHTT